MTRTITIKDSAFELMFESEGERRWVGVPDCERLIAYRKDDPQRAIAALILYQLFEFYAAENKGWLKLSIGDLELLIEKVHYFVREFEFSLR